MAGIYNRSILELATVRRSETALRGLDILEADEAKTMRLFAGTEFDRPPKCDRCGKLESECQCPEPIAEPANPSTQTALIRYEKRKKGKWVTTVRGLDSTGPHLADILTALKNHCGAGGTIQDDVLEIQGDHGDRIANLLSARGYRVKIRK